MHLLIIRLPSIPLLQASKTHEKMKYKEKEFIKLRRRFVNLKYRITKARLSDEIPSNDMLKEFSDIERIVCIISKAYS